LPREVVEWVLEAIEELEEDPFWVRGSASPAGLRGLYCFKLRRGDCRLIYCYVPARDVVYIVAVGHRDEVDRGIDTTL